MLGSRKSTFSAKEFDKTPVEVIIKVQSLIEANISLTGKATGRQYTWAKAGDIADVDERDVEDLLTKRLGKKQCCGSGGNKIFQLVGGDHA